MILSLIVYTNGALNVDNNIPQPAKFEAII